MLHQNTPLLTNISKRELIYWHKKLENIAPKLDFPTDYARLNHAKYQQQSGNYRQSIGQKLFTLSTDVSQSLKIIGRQHHVFLSTVLLSAFKILLHRYTKQTNIIVGCVDLCPKNKQPQLEIVPLAITIKPNKRISELFKQIQPQITEACNYCNLTLDELEASLQSQQPSPPISALYQILFRFHPLTANPEQLYELELNAQSIHQELLLDIVAREENLLCRIEYDRDLFELDTIIRLASNYQVLLKSICADPEATLQSLPLLTATEKHQVLFEWNDTQTERELRCLHELFEAQVERNPDAVALICQGKQLTYGELNTQANQLAHYLKSLGVKPESLVGLALERSLEMVVGVLGILKAGSAYVPLDLENPPARIAFILEDAQISVLVTQAKLLAKLPQQIQSIVCLDRDRDLITAQPQHNGEINTTATNLAHIVYTSGSTGKPKGVMLTHGNLSHYAHSLQLALEVSPADVYLHRGSIALIVSARQLLMPLAVGATAVIITTQEKSDPIALFELIKRHGVTIVDHVPSFWRGFAGILNQLSSDRRKSLLDNQVRLVAAGGEQVTPEIYQCWRDIFKPEVKLANIYGQTEGTGVVTVYPIPESIDQRFKSLPVGSPIPNMRVYLLDENLQPVPIGVAAEIHISGAGVAQGYLNRPQLTAEKFVPNPYVSGETLYKTGDLGRYLADGTIQFLGRVDRQVNLQGLRIELGEIEAVLSQQELVQETAVIVQENNLGELLVGYVVPSLKQQPTEAELRNFLKQKLPSYMIPSRFIFLAAFPLTTSGKVDRRALSQLKETKQLPESDSVIPRDRLESELVEMLQNILGIDRIGIRDNFLELGGNSLLAARLVTQIENQYSKTLSIANIFQAPTPEDLANLLRQENQNPSPKSFVPIKSGNSQPNIFCIHYLGYGLEYYLPLAQYLDSEYSLCGLSVEMSNDPNAPHPRDIAALATYYVQDLETIQPHSPYYLIGVSFGGVVAYEIAQQLVAKGHRVNLLGLIDSHCPDGHLAYRVPPLPERLSDHVNNISQKGSAYILEKIQRRFQIIKDHLQSRLYNLDWVRQNLIDDMSKEYAQAKYLALKQEHEQVNQNYSMQVYPGRVTLFRATEDPDSKLEWQEFVRGGLEIIDIPGDHLEILQEPSVQVLAEQLKLQIMRSQ